MIKATVVAIIGLVIAAGLAAGYAWRHWAPAEPGETGGIETTNTTTTGGGPQGGPNGTQGHGQGQGGMGPGGPGMSGEMANSTCNSIGNMTIGESIQWLLDNHDKFNYTLSVYPENMSIVWVINAEDPESAQILYHHIEQMECVLKNGGTPRPNDPLFVVDAQISSQYVNTSLEWINETAFKVVKVAANDCAFEVIKLHADVVQGFFDTGRAEASQTHEVPEDVAQICQPYLADNTTSTNTTG